MCSSHGTAAVLLLLTLLCRARPSRGRVDDPQGVPAEVCNVTADGRELTCRGAGLLSVLQPLESAILQAAVNLTRLDLTNNNITDIPVRAFHRICTLEVLLLRRNRIEYIEDDAFANLTSLRVLDLDDNYLTKIPVAVLKLPSLEDLSVSNNKIERLEGGVFGRISSLASLDLRGNPIKEIHENTFQDLRKLRKLILSNTKDLRTFPNLNGTESLEVLRIDRAHVNAVPADLCEQCPRLKSFDVKSNYLTDIPNLRNCKDLRVLDLASNIINSITGEPFRGLTMLHDLLLSDNNLRSIPSNAFVGLSRLQVLDLESNRIEMIHPEAFKETKQLEDLNLGNNVFPTLPIEGLSSLLHLKTFNNPALREFPSPERFPRVQTMVLSYAYHCCSFLELELEETVTKSPVHESILFPTDEFDMSLWNSSLSDIWPQLNNLSEKFGSRINELWANFGSDFTYPGNLPSYVEDYFDEQSGRATLPARPIRHHIQCLPQPGPFLPCQDLFDWWTLRCGVWIVFLLAMLGNGTVVFVLIFSRSKMDVPRFLVCNLAAADFFMGIYLDSWMDVGFLRGRSKSRIRPSLMEHFLNTSMSHPLCYKKKVIGMIN